MTAPTAAIASYVFQCNEELKTSCEAVKKERQKLFEAKPVTQRIAFYICEAFNKGGLWIGIGCIAVGTIFSAKFLIVGAAAFAAFIIGNIARAYFETTNPAEEYVMKLLTEPSLLGITKDNKDNLPKAKLFQEKREMFLDSTNEIMDRDFDKITKDQKTNFYAFYSIYGGQGLVEQILSKKPKTKEEEEQIKAGKKIVFEKLEKCRILYTSSLLLESIQHIAEKNLPLAKKQAEQAHKVYGTFTNGPSQDTFAKMKELAKALKDPSPKLQAKVKQIFEQQGKKATFKLSDLDTVYAIAKAG